MTRADERRIEKLQQEAGIHIRSLATFAAIDQFLTNYNYKDDPASLDPSSIIDAIRHDCEDEEEIVRWEPFENMPNKELADAIEAARDYVLMQFKEVAGILKGYVVDLACDDLLDVDLTTLDLRGCVPTKE